MNRGRIIIEIDECGEEIMKLIKTMYYINIIIIIIETFTIYLYNSSEGWLAIMIIAMGIQAFGFHLVIKKISNEN